MIKTLEALALVDWYYVLGIGAVLSAATLFAYRKALRPLFLYLRGGWRRLKEALTSIEAIRREMFTNGGTSMRDAMNRVTDIVKELAKDTAMSVAQNRALSEQSAIGMFQGDIEGAVIWSNEALRQLTGLRPEQIAGRGWIGGVDAADRRLVESDWMLSTANRSPYTALFRLTHVGTGLSTPVKCEATPVFADGGIGSGWLAIFRVRKGDT